MSFKIGDRVRYEPTDGTDRVTFSDFIGHEGVVSEALSTDHVMVAFDDGRQKVCGLVNLAPLAPAPEWVPALPCTMTGPEWKALGESGALRGADVEHRTHGRWAVTSIDASLLDEGGVRLRCEDSSVTGALAWSDLANGGWILYSLAAPEKREEKKRMPRCSCEGERDIYCAHHGDADTSPQAEEKPAALRCGKCLLLPQACECGQAASPVQKPAAPAPPGPCCKRQALWTRRHRAGEATRFSEYEHSHSCTNYEVGTIVSHRSQDEPDQPSAVVSAPGRLPPPRVHACETELADLLADDAGGYWRWR